MKIMCGSCEVITEHHETIDNNRWVVHTCDACGSQWRIPIPWEGRHPPDTGHKEFDYE